MIELGKVIEIMKLKLQINVCMYVGMYVCSLYLK